LNVHSGTVKAKAHQSSGAGHYIVARGADKIDYPSLKEWDACS